jgi:hypothetical protein
LLDLTASFDAIQADETLRKDAVANNAAANKRKLNEGAQAVSMCSCLGFFAPKRYPYYYCGGA